MFYFAWCVKMNVFLSVNIFFCRYKQRRCSTIKQKSRFNTTCMLYDIPVLFLLIIRRIYNNYMLLSFFLIKCIKVVYVRWVAKFLHLYRFYVSHHNYIWFWYILKWHQMKLLKKCVLFCDSFLEERIKKY